MPAVPKDRVSVGNSEHVQVCIGRDAERARFRQCVEGMYPFITQAAQKKYRKGGGNRL